MAGPSIWWQCYGRDAGMEPELGGKREIRALGDRAFRPVFLLI